MRTLFALATGLAAAAAAAPRRWTADDLAAGDVPSYGQWLSAYSPKYAGSEQTYNANVAKILAHNKAGTSGWKAGINQVSAAAARSAGRARARASEARS